MVRIMIDIFFEMISISMGKESMVSQLIIVIAQYPIFNR